MGDVVAPNGFGMRWSALFTAVLVAVVAALCSAAAAVAAPPSNDAFASAIELSLDASVAGTNVEATGEPGEPPAARTATSRGGLRTGCTDSVTPDNGCLTSVWYSFTPIADGVYTVSLCDAATAFDTTLGVYTGTLGSLASVGEDDDSCGGGSGSRVSFTATAGTPYHFAVEGFGATTGSFVLRLYAGPETLIDQTANSVAPRAGFSLTSTGGPGTFECAIDLELFAPCDEAVEYLGFASGSSHQLRARATAGGSTDATPAVLDFAIDDTPPDTTIPSDPSGVNNAVAVTSTQPGSTFFCTIDGSARFRCGGPGSAAIVSFADASIDGLCNGPHTLTAVAVDPAGNEDPSPASREFTKAGGPACSAPSGSTGNAVDPHSTGAVLGSSMNGGGSQVSWYFEYGTTTDYGARSRNLVAAGGCGCGVVLGGLAPSTTYHYRVVYTTANGTFEGADRTFTTQAATADIPVVTADAPTRIGQTVAVVPGSVTPNGPGVSYTVLYDTGPVGLFSREARVRALGSGDGDPHAVSVPILGLRPGTTYRYRIYAWRTTGSRRVGALSEERTFTTRTMGPATGMDLSVGPAVILADGSSTATATARVTDAHGDRVSGEALEFSSTDPDQRVSAAAPQGNGVYTATITSSTTVGNATIKAVDTSADPDLERTAPLRQKALPGSITVTPDSLPDAIEGRPYSQSLGAGAGTAPYTFAVTAGAMPAGLSLTQAGALSGSPTTPGSYTFTVTATDSDGVEGSRSYTLTVEADDAPVTGADLYATDEDTALTRDAAAGVLANDSDDENDTLTAAVVTGPAHAAAFTLNGDGSFEYTPEADFHGDDSFTYEASDGRSETLATVTLTVSPVDDAPLAVDDVATVTEDAGPTAVEVLANDTDVDAGPKRVASITQAAHGVVAAAADGSGVGYTPTGDYCNSEPGGAPDRFTYTLEGGSQAVVSVTVTCVDEVLPPPAEPEIVPEPARLSIGHRRVPLKRGRVVLELSCLGVAGQRCTGGLTLKATSLSSRLGAAAAGRARFDIAAGETQRLRVKPTPALRAVLRKRGRAIARVSATLRDPAGAATTVERLVTVQRARRR
jgi:VCBS repeat-containing protein